MISPRIEKKIILNTEKFYELKSFLEFLLPLDSHTPKDQSYYEVYSLYYDSPENDFFYEKLDGTFEHNKIRLRSYSSDVEDNCFLEHKFKRGEHLIKIRSEKLNQTDIFHPYKSCSKGKTQDYFEYFFQLYSLTPKTLVYYKRMAFQGVIDDVAIRANFDFDIKYQQFQNKEKYRNVTMLKNTSIIFELKSEREVPSIILEKLKSLNLPWQSFSKYASGRIHLNLVR